MNNITKQNRKEQISEKNFKVYQRDSNHLLPISLTVIRDTLFASLTENKKEHLKWLEFFPIGYVSSNPLLTILDSNGKYGSTSTTILVFCASISTNLVNELSLYLFISPNISLLVQINSWLRKYL